MSSASAKTRGFVKPLLITVSVVAALGICAVVEMQLKGGGGAQHAAMASDSGKPLAQVRGASFSAPVAATAAEKPGAGSVKADATGKSAEPAMPNQISTAAAAASTPDQAAAVAAKVAATPAVVVASAAQPVSSSQLDISKIPSIAPAFPNGGPSPPPAAAVQSKAAASASTAKPATAPGQYLPVGFNLLAGYKYNEPKGKTEIKPEESSIPADIRALNGQAATVEGYMVPLEVDDTGAVKAFVLVKNQPQCCFGDTQALNDWIDVKWKGASRVEITTDRPVSVSGRLDIGEKMEDGYVLSIYRMSADKVEM